jgi:hypothetical protein
MEAFGITLDDGTGKAFDEALRNNTLADYGQIQLITKDSATEEINPAVMLTFKVLQTDGTTKNAQTVTTAKLFLSAAKVIDSRYPGLLK